MLKTEQKTTHYLDAAENYLTLAQKNFLFVIRSHHPAPHMCKQALSSQGSGIYAEWQAKSEGNTFDVEDYVSYVQERQQERNTEIDAFVNRDNGS
ncbi:hypothetical protein [Alcaligenes faecalis]|nr:hypothetical protein [Alcaligenes faecalis]